MPRASRLRARVQFQRQAAGPNVGGVAQGAWAPIGDPVAVELRPRMGGEGILAGRLQGREVYELTLRGSAFVRGLTVQDCAVDQAAPDRPFNIQNITNPDMRGAWYLMLVERKAAGG